MMKWEFEVRFKGLQALWKDQSSVNVAGLSKLHDSCTLNESFYSPAGERLMLKCSPTIWGHTELRNSMNTNGGINIYF